MVRVLRALVVLGIVTLSVTGIVVASPATNISDIASTRHNLSSAAGATTTWGSARNVQATGVVGQGTDQLCVFCHTPHGATIGLEAPLWNRSETGQFYAVYDSLTTDAIIAQPAGTSKLCLSCHDGTVAVGTVNTITGQADITMVTNAGFIDATGLLETTPATSGFSRYIGTDLSNDHPISFDYSSAMALTFDGELFAPPGPGTADIALRASPMPNLPLENTGSNKGDAVYQVQCGTCHDPHVYDSTLTVSSKFLRLNRFQTATPSQGGFNENFDIICLACHDKAGWADSIHAVATGSCSGTIVGKGCADETFLNVPAVTVDREFPVGMPVWQAACLNCHDTHTKEGSRRLLREGADANNKSAIENTCFQCHGATPIIDNPDGDLPDIETEFLKGGVPGSIGAGGSRMPIYNLDQVAQDESEHEISNADFQEDSPPIPSGSIGRHAECTDCHNPHRMLNNELADGTGPGDKPTHDHGDSGAEHSNLISGALAGTTGVEPVWADATGLPKWQTYLHFGNQYFAPFVPTASNFVSSWTVLCGNPGDPATADCPGGPVTKEWQICFRCHTDYAYGDNLPQLEVSGGGTAITTATPLATGANNSSGNPTSNPSAFDTYTNQAIEFYPGRCWNRVAELELGTCDVQSGGEQGEWQWGDAGLPAQYTATNEAINHRSWHPVLYPTGRTGALRGADVNNWWGPFNIGVGTQTMYCSDCHGSDNDGAAPDNTALNPSSRPAGSDPWGPHGSSHEFLLRGLLGSSLDNTTVGDTHDSGNSYICTKCHDENVYNGAGPSGADGGPLAANSSGWRHRWDGDAGGCVGGEVYNNLHQAHAGFGKGFERCTWCHVAVPHGWPSKQLLAKISENPGCDDGSTAPFGPDPGGPAYPAPCNDPPYFQQAWLGSIRDNVAAAPAVSGSTGLPNTSASDTFVWRMSGDYDAEGCGTRGGWMNPVCGFKY